MTQSYISYGEAVKWTVHCGLVIEPHRIHLLTTITVTTNHFIWLADIDLKFLYFFSAVSEYIL